MEQLLTEVVSFSLKRFFLELAYNLKFLQKFDFWLSLTPLNEIEDTHSKRSKVGKLHLDWKRPFRSGLTST